MCFFFLLPKRQQAASVRCLKFNITHTHTHIRAILAIQYNGDSQASALNSGNTVRSLAIGATVQTANLKAAVNIEKDNDEKEQCYLVEHKATEKPFDIIPLKPRGTL